MSLLPTLRSLVPERSFPRLLWHRLRGFLAALITWFPARHLVVIGVTGTDGKTTTVGMIAHILDAQGLPTGALSTAYLSVKGTQSVNATQKTSPSPFLIQKFLRTLVKEGCTHAVLEMSSHGLVQGRLIATWPSIAAVTNVTPEHLDYHGSLEQYREDKGRIFAILRGNGTKVLNADDASYASYRVRKGKTISTSTKTKADLRAEDIAETIHGITARITAGTTHETVQLTLPMHGSFNVENALTALGCAMAAGVSLKNAALSLRTFRGVQGRLEAIDEGQRFSVFVDFTVTPAAYEKTLTTLRRLLPPGGRLLVLTGSCGNRMREKRPIVGKICSELADVVVVTNEDPYTEDPERIIDEVWSGIDHAKTKAMRIFERREAIERLLAEATPGDIVIFCAKGSDTTMMTAQGQVPWNEREIVRELLRGMK